MYKFVALAALVAVAHGGALLSAPIAAPIAHYAAAAPIVASSAITARADSYTPIVARYAAPIAAAPIAHYAAAPIAHYAAAPIAHYAAAPVVASSAITARADGYTIAHAPIAARLAAPVVGPW